MKIVDADATLSDRSSEAIDAASVADTHASPGLRPEVLGDAAQRRTKAMIHAALFKTSGEAPTIGPYQVLKLLGEGGMGVVYAAYDDKLERKVALKLIRGAAMRRPDGRSRTLREARALARLSHPNVVHVYQVGEIDDEVYVAMEFLTGPTLRAWLAAGPRTWREVLAVFRQAGEGLAAAHRQGVIHRDFKPANAIVGDDGRVRVLDFGLAHFGEEGERTALPAAGELTDLLLTQTGAVLGTPAYMAAEQFAGGRGDAKTDQFSFCAALYEALYGQRPFAGDGLDALASAVRDGHVRPVTTRRDVPPWLHRVVLRGLQRDPAARWPSMDALLAALQPPRARWGRVAGVAGAVSALAIGGIGYAFTLESPPRSPAQDEAAARARAEALRSQDTKLLVEARAASTTDPLQAIRALSRLAGDDPATWQQARFLANAAEVRGLPAQVLRAGDRPLTEVLPLAGGGLLGRDDLGAVWRWDMSEGTGAQILPAGAATDLVTARDVPVWAAITSEAVQVFGADRAQTITLDGKIYSDWRLASDGRSLVATSSTPPTATTSWINTVSLWDRTRPGAPPQTIALAPEAFAVIADDASLVLTRTANGVRVVRPREGTETLLKYQGTPWALSADNRFAVARPSDEDGVMDVLEIATGKSRRVDADTVTMLGGSDALFSRTDHGRPALRRESLATGAVAWRLSLPNQAESIVSRLVVDPANEQFAAAIGEAWGVGDLRRGELTSFVTVPKDHPPRWVGAGALMLTTGAEVRIHRPATSPVQVRSSGFRCDLSPGGRYAVVLPYDGDSNTYTRVELATNAATTFTCPRAPKIEERGGHRIASILATVDDAGQVAMLGDDGWSCWWDEHRGARTGARSLPVSRLVPLPRGVALADAAEVEVWTGPEEQAQRFTVAGPVEDLVASPSGAALAVRSERGVQVLRVDSGAAVSVPTRAAPTGKAEVMASALAWSPDGARLAVLDKLGGALELSVWDVSGEPRELGPAELAAPGGHVLKDSPGRPRNRMAFTPSGAAVAVTNTAGSLLLVDLATREARQLATPGLYDLHMRSETDAIAVRFGHTPVMLDFAAGAVSPLTPDLERGGSTLPPIRRSEDGSVWTCAALGPGALIEIAARDESSPQDLQRRLRELAASP